MIPNITYSNLNVLVSSLFVLGFNLSSWFQWKCRALRSCKLWPHSNLQDFRFKRNVTNTITILCFQKCSASTDICTIKRNKLRINLISSVQRRHGVHQGNSIIKPIVKNIATLILVCLLQNCVSQFYLHFDSYAAIYRSVFPFIIFFSFLPYPLLYFPAFSFYKSYVHL